MTEKLIKYANVRLIRFKKIYTKLTKVDTFKMHVFQMQIINVSIRNKRYKNLDQNTLRKYQCRIGMLQLVKFKMIKISCLFN